MIQTIKLQLPSWMRRKKLENIQIETITIAIQGYQYEKRRQNENIYENCINVNKILKMSSQRDGESYRGRES